MQGYTDSMIRLTEAFGSLPGIGRKTAERLTYHVLRAPRDRMAGFAKAIMDVKDTVRHCSQCHNITETDPCRICADTRRDPNVICVVEEPKDLFAIEATGTFRGLYHVLLGRIAPLENVGPEALTIGPLVQRIKRGSVKEVIMATNPNLEGDGTALCLQEALAPLGVKITRLARGLASGSVIEHANTAILADALKERRDMTRVSESGGI